MEAAIPLNQELRSQGIGASEIGAVLGLDPNKTPLDVYAEKVGLSHFSGNRFTRWGHALEDAVRAIYAQQTGYLVRPGYTMQHTRHSIAIATPDTLVWTGAKEGTPNRIQQIKTTVKREEWGEPGTDEVPERTVAQVTWEMFVAAAALGAPIEQADVTPLFLGEDFRRGDLPIYTVTFNLALAESMLVGASRFWNEHVLPRVPPPVAADAPQYADYLHARHPKPNGMVLQADDATVNLILAYDQARKAEKEAKAEKDRLNAAICAVIGDADGVAADGIKATWRLQKGSSYTVEKKPGRVLDVRVKEAH
jgi:putative phage-type endonuclease